MNTFFWQVAHPGDLQKILWDGSALPLMRSSFIAMFVFVQHAREVERHVHPCKAFALYSTGQRNGISRARLILCARNDFKAALLHHDFVGQGMPSSDGNIMGGRSLDA